MMTIFSNPIIDQWRHNQSMVLESSAVFHSVRTIHMRDSSHHRAVQKHVIMNSTVWQSRYYLPKKNSYRQSHRFIFIMDNRTHTHTIYIYIYIYIYLCVTGLDKVCAVDCQDLFQISRVSFTYGRIAFLSCIHGYYLLLYINVIT